MTPKSTSLSFASYGNAQAGGGTDDGTYAKASLDDVITEQRATIYAASCV